MGIGLAGGYGAGAASDALTDILKQKFLEQIQLAKLAEEQRQADMQHGVQQGQLGLGRDRLGLDRDKLGEDTRQFDVTAGQRDRTIKLDEEAQPVQLGRIRAETAEIQRKPQAEQEERDFITGRDKTNYGFDLGKIRAQGDQGARVATIRAIQAGAGQGAQPQSPYAAERTRRIVQSVDALDKKISPWTTGAGSLFSFLPATDARNFKAELDTLKSNIAFGELAEMRAASKTGGALGAISEKELTLLESALGALDPGQSPANFRAQLQQIKRSLETWEQAKAGGGQPAPAGGGFRVVEIK